MVTRAVTRTVTDPGAGTEPDAHPDAHPDARAETASDAVPDTMLLGTTAGAVEMVVHGRNVVIPEHFRTHVEDKLAKLSRYDHKIHRADVELTHEKNPRQNGSCQHVEITCRTRGPVVRSEACAEDFYKALDLAADRLERRLRQAADRRRIHHGRRTPASVAEATAGLSAGDFDVNPAAPEAIEEPDGPGQVVRVKDHAAGPMTVDQALFEMELVGHDFFLFCDSDTGRPSVVYRRHAYDYGLIRLSHEAVDAARAGLADRAGPA